MCVFSIEHVQEFTLLFLSRLSATWKLESVLFTVPEETIKMKNRSGCALLRILQWLLSALSVQSNAFKAFKAFKALCNPVSYVLSASKIGY